MKLFVTVVYIAVMICGLAVYYNHMDRKLQTNHVMIQSDQCALEYARTVGAAGHVPKDKLAVKTSAKEIEIDIARLEAANAALAAERLWFMSWAAIISCWIPLPFICYNIALSKGMNVSNAAVSAIFLGLFAVFYYAFAPSLKKTS